jgi:GNAT superfamily N-acetyltransferase
MQISLSLSTARETKLMVIVRPAGANDAASLATLRFALRSSVREAPEDRVRFIDRTTVWMRERLSDASHWRCWVAESNEEIVGCVWIQRVEKLPNPNGLPEHNAYLSNFFVAEQHRGRGVGATLLDTALGWCDTNGIDITFLWPTERSRPIYARYGFSAVGGIMERSSR